MNIDDIRKWPDKWPAYWQRLQSALLDPKVDEAALEASLREAQARMPVPVLWLLGKTQAGKTSIIRALTGSETAEIGNGFQPCTRTARFYDYPAELPVVRFLDTRGLGEVAYQPDEDIRFCESQAHLLVAVMKVADVDQRAVVEVVRAVRKRHPEWPVLLVQTGLHELYRSGERHAQPYPYAHWPLPAGVDVAPDLQRALQAQRAWLDTLPGKAPAQVVAVDLTLPEDDLPPADYGLEALWDAIEAVLPIGLQQQLRDDAAVRDVYARAAHPHIVGYAVAAAGLGAVPVVDLVAVSGVQAKLLHTLAALYGQRWDGRTVGEFVSLLGASVATGVASRMLAKSVVKLIPVWGQTAGALWGASVSGATTYALGKAAAHFFAARNAGREADAERLRKVYAEALDSGKALLKQRLRAAVGAGEPPEAPK